MSRYLVTVIMEVEIHPSDKIKDVVDTMDFVGQAIDTEILNIDIEDI